LQLITIAAAVVRRFNCPARSQILGAIGLLAAQRGSNTASKAAIILTHFCRMPFLQLYPVACLGFLLSNALFDYFVPFGVHGRENAQRLERFRQACFLLVRSTGPCDRFESIGKAVRWTRVTLEASVTWKQVLMLRQGRHGRVHKDFQRPKTVGTTEWNTIGCHNDSASFVLRFIKGPFPGLHRQVFTEP